jgi:hypothetical protein
LTRDCRYLSVLINSSLKIGHGGERPPNTVCVTIRSDAAGVIAVGSKLVRMGMLVKGAAVRVIT